MPALLPNSAAANQIQPCSDPEATPPTKAPILQPKPRRAPQPISNPPIAAAKSEGAGGQLARAKGREPAAAAMAPKIMPRLVRLAVSLRMESDSACFGPGHCQNSARERSAPSRFATLAPQTVNPNVTLQRWPPRRARGPAVERPWRRVGAPPRQQQPPPARCSPASPLVRPKVRNSRLPRLDRSRPAPETQANANCR